MVGAAGFEPTTFRPPVGSEKRKLRQIGSFSGAGAEGVQKRPLLTLSYRRPTKPQPTKTAWEHIIENDE
jgi:hypothetical protein